MSFGLFLMIILIIYLVISNKRENFSMNYKYPLIAQTDYAMSKLSKNPIVFPRTHDTSTWSVPGYRHSSINDNNSKYDLSENFNCVDDTTNNDITDNNPQFDELVQTYTGFGLDSMPVEQVTTTPISQVTQSIQPTTTPISQVTREQYSAPLPGYKTDLLFPRTFQTIHGPSNQVEREREKYLTRYGEDQYSSNTTSQPINSNLGISYAPSFPPRVLDQVQLGGTSNVPLFHRVDPQFIRDHNISANRLGELPRRTDWSAKYSDLEAASNDVNMENITDPRFNGYGDKYRSFVDVNAGNVQYYYTDIDNVYRNPMFDSTRSRVDFINYTNPMGAVIPEYSRKVGVSDIRSQVENQFASDTEYFRQDIMEKQMRKRNSEMWQLRAAPISKSANSHFSSN